jgi:hypothetical protein
LSVHCIGRDVRSTNLGAVRASSTLVNAVIDAVRRNRREGDREYVRCRMVEVWHTKETRFGDEIAAAMMPLLHWYEG